MTAGAREVRNRKKHPTMSAVFFRRQTGLSARRIFGLVAACLVAAAPLSAVFAQDTPPTASSPALHAHRLQERFDAANTTHDGHLTLLQAQDGDLRMVANHFDDIDIGHKGYVTLNDVRHYAQVRRAARRDLANGASPALQGQR
ncbi:hypothetical protein [Lichenicoccus roseus]|uniref:hypothetical protein n=1 Tax=Lichenicoccus roseus TaxID=2683649 RepID=UPI00197E8164|nr:hypothetical protein [Lichenicoccus roseus]